MEPNRTWNLVTRQLHSITAPSHLTRIETLERTPCFRVVSPCAEAEASREAAMRVYSDVPAAGSELSPDDACGPLLGGTWRSIPSPGGDSHFPWVEVCADTGLGLIREQKRSTQIKEEQQLVQEDSFPMSRMEGLVSHTTEGQGRPEVRVATWAAGEPGPVGGWRRTPPPKPPRPNKPPTSKPLSPNMQMAIFNSMLKYYADVNDTRPEDLEPKQAEPKGEKVGRCGSGKGGGGPSPAQEAEAAPPDAELEAPPPPELSPPPAASPAAAVEPGPAPEETEAPAPLDGEPSLEPMLAPASEEELPVELPIQGPLVKWAHPVPGLAAAEGGCLGHPGHPAPLPSEAGSRLSAPGSTAMLPFVSASSPSSSGSGWG
ncbi:hypothetical protein QTO34_005497 [Cnephaeus nilssonii]|uniref:Uncharacterized protein n=1 Tax=Cnephaeus nilssonii TaxID=3371016 RepID=A0AA40HPJ3_CNENI|nr:hypothetical protein QTO34_005497 [Eptesicus nilssonii]